jgi:hypothetical protein
LYPFQNRETLPDFVGNRFVAVDVFLTLENGKILPDRPLKLFTGPSQLPVETPDRAGDLR